MVISTATQLRVQYRQVYHGKLYPPTKTSHRNHYAMHLNPVFGLLLSAATLVYSSPVNNVTSGLHERGDCGSHSCVKFYADGGCISGKLLSSYQPTCEGNCYQYSSFSSIEVMGNTITGVDCIAYSDSNCQNKGGDSGNQHGDHCLENLNGAQSMKCYCGC